MIEQAAPPRTALHRLGALVPFASLVLGVAAAVMMERTPRRAAVVAATATAGWLVLIGAALLERVEHREGRRGLLLRAARWSASTAATSSLQQSLFFALPFYVRATTWSPAQIVFLAILAVLAAASLWDPLITRVLGRPSTALPAQALATFSGLAVVLPILGLSNRAGLIGGALGAALGVPLFAALVPTGLGRARARLLVAVALAVPALLLVPQVRSMIPAAPLHFTSGAIGTLLVDRELADPATRIDGTPTQLVCVTAIDAPRGLRDRIVHAWSHDGWLVDRIPVEVRGGRDRGFRTYSVKRNLGAAEGVWTCTVETASGQQLGVLRTEIHAPKN